MAGMKRKTQSMADALKGLSDEDLANAAGFYAAIKITVKVPNSHGGLSTNAKYPLTIYSYLVHMFLFCSLGWETYGLGLGHQTQQQGAQRHH